MRRLAENISAAKYARREAGWFEPESVHCLKPSTRSQRSTQRTHRGDLHRLQSRSRPRPFAIHRRHLCSRCSRDVARRSPLLIASGNRICSLSKTVNTELMEHTENAQRRSPSAGSRSRAGRNGRRVASTSSAHQSTHVGARCFDVCCSSTPPRAFARPRPFAIDRGVSTRLTLGNRLKLL